MPHMSLDEQRRLTFSSESPANDRSRDRPDRPHDGEVAKPLPSKSKLNQICHDNFTECNHTTGTHALEHAADQHHGKLFRGSRNSGSSYKEYQGSEELCNSAGAWIPEGETMITHRRLSSEDVGKRGKRRLYHRRREQIGCTSPEGLGTCPMNVIGDHGESYREGGPIQRCCQRGDGEGSKN